MFKWKDWGECSSGKTGEVTYEHFSVIAADDPVTCAAYAKQHDILALEGWHRLRNLVKRDEVLARAIKQSKIRQVGRSQTYLITRNYFKPCNFDKKNKNSKWYDAIKLEMESMQENKWYSKSGIKQFLINTKRLCIHLRDITKSMCILCLLSSLMVDIKLDWWQMAT